MPTIDRGHLPADPTRSSPSVIDEDDDLDESESAENKVRLSLESTKSPMEDACPMIVYSAR
jgi:hypothetical protein